MHILSGRRDSRQRCVAHTPNILVAAQMCITLCVFSHQPRRRVLCQPDADVISRETQRILFLSGDESGRAIGIPASTNISMHAKKKRRCSMPARLYAVTGYASMLAEVESSARWSPLIAVSLAEAFRTRSDFRFNPAGERSRFRHNDQK